MKFGARCVLAFATVLLQCPTPVWAAACFGPQPTYGYVPNSYWNNYFLNNNATMGMRFSTDDGQDYLFFGFNWDYGGASCGLQDGRNIIKSGGYTVYARPFFIGAPFVSHDTAHYIYYALSDGFYEMEISGPIFTRLGRNFSARSLELPFHTNISNIQHIGAYQVTVLNESVVTLTPRAATETMPALPGGTITTFVFHKGIVPEPASWLTMVAGFGLAGGLLRWRQRPAVSAPAA